MLSNTDFPRFHTSRSQKRKDVLGLDGPSGAMSTKKAEKSAKQGTLRQHILSNPVLLY